MKEIGTLKGATPYLAMMRTPVHLESVSKYASAISDVSGHGLAGTLIDIAERYQLKISCELSEVCALAEPVINEEITLFENSPTSYGETPLEVDEGARRVSLLKETAGPLVVLTEELLTPTNDAIRRTGWLDIGSFQKGSPEVKISWRS
jgi:selenophosphate synthase